MIQRICKTVGRLCVTSKKGEMKGWKCEMPRNWSEREKRRERSGMLTRLDRRDGLVAKGTCRRPSFHSQDPRDG